MYWGIRIFAILFPFIVINTFWDYWRFVVQGEFAQATIVNVSEYRGVKGRRSYTYTVQSIVHDVTITDSYNASSTNDGAVGDVIEVFVSTSEAVPEIAVASSIRDTPINAGVPFLVISGILGWYFYSNRNADKKTRI